ncbi:MAG: matrixin family metalloprotease [Polyangiaceae bacterium]|nr:matrixin family metalloprotease [Polyangiaceae bacterium]
MTRALGAAAVALVSATFVASVSSTAGAYCRTSSCEDGVGALCFPSQPSDCGIPLFWPSRCVGYSLQKDASAQVDLNTASNVAAQAFAAWSDADCGGGTHPAIEAQDLGPVTCDKVEYNQQEENANVIVFRDASWPHPSSALALTTVTYALETGEIRDADIELNSANAVFTTGDENVQVDLLSILTHEAGHFLGLSHAPSSDATMFADYPPMSTALRTLDADDINGICAIYPADGGAACNPTPKNGMGDECADGTTGGDDDEGGSDGCSVSESTHSSGWIALLGAAVALGFARRRR